MRTTIIGLALILTGCVQGPKILKEGEGWREVEASPPAGPGMSAMKSPDDRWNTRIEITTADEALLGRLARTNPDVRVRREASERVRDQAVLTEIARHDDVAFLRRRAVERLYDKAILLELSSKDPDPGVKEAAANRREVLREVIGKHPEYRYWAACRPGASVRLKMEVKTGYGPAWDAVELGRTFVDLGPQGAYYEQKLIPSGAPLGGLARLMLADLEEGTGRLEEGDETVELSGRKLACHWVKSNAERRGVILRVKTWYSGEVPGGIAKIEMEEAPLGEPMRFLRARTIGWDMK